MKHGLNTNDRVQRKNPQFAVSPNWCVMCRKDVESIDHLLFHCMVARSLWLKVLGEVGLTWVFPARCRDLMLESTVGFGSSRMVRVLWNSMVLALL